MREMPPSGQSALAEPYPFERVRQTSRKLLRLFPMILRIFQRWPIIAVAILGLLAIMGIFAPFLAPHDPIKPDLKAVTVPPMWLAGGSGKHILGTDQIGRDILSRLIYGARVSLMVVTIATATGLFVGAFMGLAAGYFGGLLDEVLMRIVDISMAIPFILIALVVVVAIGQSFAVLMGVLALSAWAHYVRNTRAEVLSLKERDYVALAKIANASAWRIMFRHILPGVINTVIVIATLRVGHLIITEAILSFLGAGVPPPTPTWGVMVSDGRSYLASAWWICLFPGLAILLVVMAFNFLGDWFRDRFDPRLRQLQ